MSTDAFWSKANNSEICISITTLNSFFHFLLFFPNSFLAYLFDFVFKASLRPEKDHCFKPRQKKKIKGNIK